MDYNLPGSSVPGIVQARVMEWVAIPFSRGSSWSRDQTQVSRIAGRRFTIWATREPCVCVCVCVCEAIIKLWCTHSFVGNSQLWGKAVSNLWLQGNHDSWILSSLFEPNWRKSAPAQGTAMSWVIVVFHPWLLFLAPCRPSSPMSQALHPWGASDNCSFVLLDWCLITHREVLLHPKVLTSQAFPLRTLYLHSGMKGASPLIM